MPGGDDHQRSERVAREEEHLVDGVQPEHGVPHARARRFACCRRHRDLPFRICRDLALCPPLTYAIDPTSPGLPEHPPDGMKRERPTLEIGTTQASPKVAPPPFPSLLSRRAG